MEKSLRLLFKILCFLLLCGNISAQEKQSTKPFVIGEIYQLYSDSLKENRIINVYLPADYHLQDSVRYKVVYVLDGSAEEDFVHISGLVQFFTMMQMIKPTIVVGIANVDRKRDFTFPTSVAQDKIDYPSTGHSAPFMAFIESELLPFVENNFKTNGNKTIIGQSLGGLLVSELLLKNLFLFQNYLIVSPSLWWDNGSLFKRKITRNPDFNGQHADIRICVGNEEKIMVKQAKQFYKWIKGEQFKTVRVSHYYFEKENHATILHNAAYEGLLYFLSH